MKTSNARLSIAVSAFTLVVVVYAGLGAREFREASMWFPMFMSAVGLICTLVIIAMEVRTLLAAERAKSAGNAGNAQSAVPRTPGAVTGTEAHEEQVNASAFKSFLYWMGWFAGFLVLLVALGGLIAVPLWLFAFLRFGSRLGTRFALGGAVVVTVLLIVLSYTLDFHIPPGPLSL